MRLVLSNGARRWWLAASLWAGLASVTPAEAQRLAKPSALGSRSCAAAACHGSVTPDSGEEGIHRNEYLVWFERDPHAQALRTLTGERSERMLERLGIVREGRIVDAIGYQNCLTCHSQSYASSSEEAGGQLEGVSCESCHGAAEHWLAGHYRRDWSAEEARQAGQRDTADLGTRAGICAACHVGSADREVDHDLIAAGHPMLKFELAAYQDLLPKHWNEARERRRQPWYERQLWGAGQFAAAEAALELLEHRARQAATGQRSAWPEFAEVNCYSCHHATRPLGGRSRLQVGGNSNPAWGSWYLFGRGKLLGRAAPDEAGWSVAFGELEQHMHRSLAVSPNDVALAAADARQALEHLTSRVAMAGSWEAPSERMIEALLAELDRADEPAAARDLPQDWDTATQSYLALCAADQAYRDEAARRGGRLSEDDQELQTLLREWRSRLAFPPGFDSPRTSPGSAAASAESEPSTEEVVRRIRKLMGSRRDPGA